MVGVFHRTMVMLQTQPGDSAVVVLDEFAIGFEALIFVHDKILVAFFDIQHPIQERSAALDLLAIGATLGFHLQDAEVHAHLDDIPSVVSFDQADGESVRIERPVPQDFIQPF
jgi:hypothetical protein